jgi:hypothetical protein
MMNRALGRALSLVGAAIVVAAVVQSPAAATVPSGALWASPGGSGTKCTKAAPCSIEQGFSSVPMNGTLVLDPGSYGTEAAPLTATLQSSTARVEGEPGKPAPTIVSDVAGDSDGFVAEDVSHLRMLDLAEGDGLIVEGGVMDHVAVFADTTKTAAACVSLNSLVTNSLCVNTGLGAYGLGVLTEGSVPLTVQASTAVDTRSKSGGVAVGNLDSHSTGVISLINVLAVGGSGGAVSGVFETGLTHANTTVEMSHCDAKGLVSHTSIHGSLTIHHNRTDITGAPKFVNAAGDNFAERAGSPTINRGVKNLLEGATDLAGRPRVLGTAPDIGAYEFAQPPAGLRMTVLTKTAHSIRVKVSANPEGLLTHTAVTGRPTTRRSVHTLSGDKVRSYVVTIPGLKPTTSYTLELRATNGGGSSRKVIHVSTT